jgi:hypothetical protein
VNAKRASIQAIRSAREFKPYVHTRTYGLKESVYSSHTFRERIQAIRSYANVWFERERLFKPSVPREKSASTYRVIQSGTRHIRHKLLQPQAALLATLLAASRAHTMHVRSCAAEREFASATASGAQHPNASAAYTYENTRFRASSSRTASGMMSASAPAYVSTRQHTSASVSIRQHPSAYVSIRRQAA